MSDSGKILTVGHSNLAYEDFFQLLRRAGVTGIADVRSAPYSRFHPHFNAETLKRELKADGIAYASLGEELGGRPKDKRFFCNGVADYELMAQAPSFKKGLDRVIKGNESYQIALMCSEHDPLDCHRCLLVGRALHERGVAVEHLLGSGRRKSQEEIEQELLTMARQDRADMFPDSQISSAYRDRSLKVAYSETDRPSDVTAAE